MLINEMFLSLQGEGYESGELTYFIRTARCNLQCSWCDTKFQDPATEMRVLEVIGKVSRCGIKNICITGGEPLLEEDFYQLEEWLFKAGYNTVVETNGSISIENIKSQVAMDIKPPSSGMAEQFLRENLDRLKPNDQVKFIIQDIKDYDYAKEMLKDIKQGKVIFMPVWDEKFKAAKDLARWIMADRLSVRLSLQMHKILHLK